MEEESELNSSQPLNSSSLEFSADCEQGISAGDDKTVMLVIWREHWNPDHVLRHRRVGRWLSLESWLFKYIYFVYFTALGLSCGTWDLHCLRDLSLQSRDSLVVVQRAQELRDGGLLPHGMQDLSFLNQRSNLISPKLTDGFLNHWTTWEVPSWLKETGHHLVLPYFQLSLDTENQNPDPTEQWLLKPIIWLWGSGEIRLPWNILLVSWVSGTFSLLWKIQSFEMVSCLLKLLLYVLAELWAFSAPSSPVSASFNLVSIRHKTWYQPVVTAPLRPLLTEEPLH